MQWRVSRAENLEPGLVPTILIKRWQGFPETFQRVTQPGKIACCSSFSIYGFKGQRKEQEEEGPIRCEWILVTMKLTSGNPTPFRAQNFESTHELSRAQLASGGGRGRREG